MAYNRRDDDLAYGDYHPQGDDDGAEGERGIFGGRVSKRLFGKTGEQDQHQPQQYVSFCLPFLPPPHSFMCRTSFYIVANSSIS